MLATVPTGPSSNLRPPSFGQPRGTIRPDAGGAGLSSVVSSDLLLTGERTVPDVPDEAYWFARHVVAYELAAPQARGRRVLDAGCGEGYGAALLAAAGAARVVGVDLDAATVRHVADRYPEVTAVRAELGELPFPSSSFDLAVSFQVIEHVWDVAGYLCSLRRVLRPGGQLLVSTPNRLTFTPGSETPVNVFHHREFTAAELRDELATAGFRVSATLGVHHGRRLDVAERAFGGVDDLAGRSLQHRLGAAPPEAWPRSLRRVVHRVRPSWFRLRADRLDRSLDLIALCTRVEGAPPGAAP
jgi:SAM-dependent methyltransferase